MPAVNSKDRRPMDPETIIALVLLGLGVFAVGDFAVMLWTGMSTMAH
jgi:hypothetical protein